MMCLFNELRLCAGLQTNELYQLASVAFCLFLAWVRTNKLFSFCRDQASVVSFFFNSSFLQLTFGIILFLNPMIGSKGSKTAVTTEYSDCRSLTQDKTMEKMFDLLQIE